MQTRNYKPSKISIYYYIYLCIFALCRLSYKTRSRDANTVVTANDTQEATKEDTQEATKEDTQEATKQDTQEATKEATMERIEARNYIFFISEMKDIEL